MVRRDAGRDREQPDLAGRVEAEPEEDAERVHLPARVDPVGEARRNKRLMRPWSSSRASSRLLVVAAALHLAEDAQDVGQDEQVEDPDDQQERARDGGADRAAVALEAREVGADRLRSRRPGRRQREDDRRVAEREEEADAERAACPRRGTSASCCRSPRCGRRRRRGGGRRCRRACRARRAPGCGARSRGRGPSRADAAAARRLRRRRAGATRGGSSPSSSGPLAPPSAGGRLSQVVAATSPPPRVAGR